MTKLPHFKEIYIALVRILVAYEIQIDEESGSWDCVIDTKYLYLQVFYKNLN